MKLVAKIVLVMAVLAVVFIVQFELFGQRFEILFSQERCIEWFNEIKPYGWAVALVLLVGDLLLPVPATGIMAALGNVYGIGTGTLLGTLGSAGAGFTGYFLARFLGPKGSSRLASQEELDRFREFFDRWGGMAIIISRILPILPEIMAILAGLARMHPARFSLALLLGTVPTSLLFAWIGAASRSMPAFGILAAVLIPLLLWPLFLHFAVRK